MRLIGDLERRLEGESSPFRAQLLREDLARLARLRELARGAADAAACGIAARRLGWTPLDARTHELADSLEALSRAVYEYERDGGGEERETRVTAAWHALYRARMERLTGCLSTPLPRTAE